MKGSMIIMGAVKFVHCSDIHLDSPFRIGWDKSGTRRRDLKDVLKKIVNIATDEKVDFMIISGDLYENEYVSKSTILFLNDLFKSISDINIIIVPGNHDPYIKNSFYKNFKWNENVFILHENDKKILFSQQNVVFYGNGFNDFHKEGQQIVDFPRIDKNNINILVMHGTVDLEIGSDMYNSMKSEHIDEIGFDYVALGHFHNRIFGAGKRKKIYNPGCPEPLRFGDNQDCGVFIASIDDKERSLDIKFVKTNKRYYANIDVNIEDCSTDEQIFDRILEQVNGMELENGLFSFNLKGCATNGFEVDLSYIEEKLRDVVFYAKLIDSTTAAYDIENIVLEQGLRGIFVRKILGKMDLSVDSDEIELLKMALYYGLEAIENGKLENI